MSFCGGRRERQFNAEQPPAPSPTMWWAADKIMGLADGAAVSTWADSSGNGNNLTQSTGSLQPAYHVGIMNGLPAVLCDLRYMAVTMSWTSAFTICVAIQFVALPASYGQIVYGGTMACGMDAAYPYFAIHAGTNLVSTVALTAGTTAILTYSSSGSSLALRVNGTETDKATGTGTLASSINVASNNSGSSKINAYIGEIIGWNTQQTSGTITTVEAALTGKWM